MADAAGPPSVQLLYLKQFAPLHGEMFEATAGGAAVTLRLVDTAALPDTNVPGGRRDPFMLTFRSTGENVWPQAIYTITHPALGSEDIFMVPVARDEDGVTYQAVFC